MSFEEYQRKAFEFANQELDFTLQLSSFTLGLCGESGEVADIVKKYVGHNQDLDTDDLTKELGDILWYLAAVSSTLGLSLNDIARVNIKKLSTRHPTGKFDPSYHGKTTNTE